MSERKVTSEIKLQPNNNQVSPPFETQEHIDENNLFSSTHWHADAYSDDHLFYMESGDLNGNNSIHVKTNKMFGIGLAEIAGEPFIQYNDMTKNGDQSTESFLSNFMQFLKNKKVDAMHFHNVREDAYIYEYCRQNGITIASKKAPWVNLNEFENFDEYIKSVSKKIRYMFNRLPRKNECEYKTYVDQQITEEVALQVVEQKLNQLKLRGETSRLFADKAKVEQLVKMLTTTNSDFKTYVTLFYIDGVLASSSVFFVKHKKVYFYILAMDDAYSKLSPGNHIVLENIRVAYDLGCTVYDFLAPEDAYKLKWAKDSFTPVYDILLPITVKGRIYGQLYLKLLRPMLKKIYLTVQKMKPSK
ncbi:MAG: GNAT family N-acetyltransferase [Hyphomicrobiales bacterium]